MKCDEAKPYCRRCTTTGRKCDGYSILETPTANSRLASTALIASPSACPSFETLGGEKERYSFHFFRQTTTSQLSGFCSDDFWDKLILQASHHEPVIRHAVIALGAMHERFLTRNGLITASDPYLYLNEFALQQYSLAIKRLLEPLHLQEKLAVDVCLIACVLFACFEVRT